MEVTATSSVVVESAEYHSRLSGSKRPNCTRAQLDQLLQYARRAAPPVTYMKLGKSEVMDTTGRNTPRVGRRKDRRMLVRA